MVERIDADICVIGAGSGGLSVAAGASQMGATTVLIERGRMGGDCLNAGCVPSKSLLAAAHAAETARRGARFGVTATPEVDFAQTQRHVQNVISEIEPTDSVERFTGLGVRVIAAAAQFVGPREVAAGDATIRARRFVVATGSSPLLPPIPGLDSVPFLTNETVFNNPTRPEHLIVLGGGPVGVELAQAHRRLGARVTVLEMARLLGAADPELSEIVRIALLREGIEISEGAKVTAVRCGDRESPIASCQDAGTTREIAGSHLLVAAGRRPNVDGLGLEAAGVEYDARGVQVDSRLRTTNKRISAIGDVVGASSSPTSPLITPVSSSATCFFDCPPEPIVRHCRWSPTPIPSSPRSASPRPRRAPRDRAGRCEILRWPFSENDRARTEARSDGLIKVVTTAKGRILGAGIVGPHAGELIQPWVLAIDNRLKIGAMAKSIVAYPTLVEVGKRAAGSYYAPRLFSDRTKAVVRFLARFG